MQVNDCMVDLAEIQVAHNVLKVMRTLICPHGKYQVD